MFDLQLYLALPTDDTFERAASKTNAHLAALLTSGGDYLSKITIQERRYLGKRVPSSIPVHQLKSVESHLLSLLQKLAPEYTFSKNPLILITKLDDRSRI